MIKLPKRSLGLLFFAMLGYNLLFACSVEAGRPEVSVVSRPAKMAGEEGRFLPDKNAVLYLSGMKS